MRSVESEGDTIDQAIDDALGTLGVARERVEIEILAAPARGVLGFGGRKARVRATVRAPLSEALASMDARTRPDVSRETGRERRELFDVEPVRSPTTTAPGGDLELRAHRILARLIELLGVTCRVEVRPGAEPGVMAVAVTGDDGGLLIGRRGQTLDALEYLLNRMVSRDGEMVRVTLDVERYRERRQEYLESLARRLAHKARQSGCVVTLNPMSPRDRRIVHLALQDETTVSTRSEGEGHYRKVLILPSDGSKRGRADSAR